uniref:Putative secreted protein n=1 Tax=Ixodes ricinus TaxID=34613 RepID=A0A147BU71_IXORI
MSCSTSSVLLVKFFTCASAAQNCSMLLRGIRNSSGGSGLASSLGLACSPWYMKDTTCLSTCPTDLQFPVLLL